VATSHAWNFRASLRRNAFGWRGTRKAIERLNAAVGEIKRVARTDPAMAGEGAVLLLEKLSPAVNQIDSSSGALDNAANGVVEKMVPLIAAAPVPRRVREKWLERLFGAIHEDDPPYIESLGEHWGALCADPALASHWADQLLPLVRHVLAGGPIGWQAVRRPSVTMSLGSTSRPLKTRQLSGSDAFDIGLSVQFMHNFPLLGVEGRRCELTL